MENLYVRPDLTKACCRLVEKNLYVSAGPLCVYYIYSIYAVYIEYICVRPDFTEG